MVYKRIWRDGARFTADAEKVGSELDSLGAELTPEKVVQAAKKKSAELHKCFTWDDSEAAKEYRLSQARVVLCSIAYEVEQDDGAESEPMQIRMYEGVKVATGTEEDSVKKHVYVNTFDALKDISLKKQIFGRIDMMLSTAQTLAENYHYLTEKMGEVQKSIKKAREYLAT